MAAPIVLNQQILSKQWYSIGEAARILSVSASVLRYWETQFKQIKPKTLDNGERRYQPEDLQLLAKIQDLLKNKGYTIMGAQNYLSQQDDQNRQIIESLNRLKNFLAQLNNML